LAVDLIKQGQSHDQLICLAMVLLVTAHAVRLNIISDDNRIGESVQKERGLYKLTFSLFNYTQVIIRFIKELP